jgi:hypothetical protein
MVRSFAKGEASNHMQMTKFLGFTSFEASLRDAPQDEADSWPAKGPGLPDQT